jgi:hypothetical protein
MSIKIKEKGPQLVKKFPGFFGTRRFVSALATARHLSLSLTRSIYSMLSTTFL